MDTQAMKVLIIEDHPAMACGTQWIVEQIPGAQVIGIAPSGQEGIELALGGEPDVVILDMQLPDMNGKEVAARLKEQKPETKIILFTGHDYIPLLSGFIELEVDGFLSKSASPRQVARLLEAVMEGDTIIPLEIFRRLRLESGGPKSSTLPLSEQERKIMRLVSKGHTNMQIAKEIFMSTRSVENYLSKIYEKLQVKTRPEAVEKFIRGSGE